MVKRLGILLAVAAVAGIALAATIGGEGYATVVPHAGVAKKAVAKARYVAEGAVAESATLEKSAVRASSKEGYSEPGLFAGK